MSIQIKVIGAQTLATRFRAMAVDVQPALHTAALKGGTDLLRSIRAHASGRPGPRAITGAYRRSWTKRVIGKTAVSVGTNAPQPRRLEQGFVGADRLGRVYHQPPFPHIEPAVAEIRPQFVAACDAAVRKVTQ